VRRRRLLIPPLRQHLAAGAQGDARLAIAGLRGFIEGLDADPSAVWITNVVLAAELLPVLVRVPDAKRRPRPRLARVQDGLAPPRGPREPSC